MQLLNLQLAKTYSYSTRLDENKEHKDLLHGIISHRYTCEDSANIILHHDISLSARAKLKTLSQYLL